MGKEADSKLQLARTAGIAAVVVNFGEDWKLTLVGLGVVAGTKCVDYFDSRRERKEAEKRNLNQGQDK